jgi:signal transduction histidine kinase
LTGRDGRTIGVVWLGGKQEGDFTEQDEAIVFQIAQTASAALENGRLLEETRQAVRLRDDVLAIVSHELRNPLSALSIIANLLLQPSLSSERRVQQVETIRRLTVRMTNLVKNLLDVGTIETGLLAVRASPQDVPGLLGETLEALKPLAAEKGIRLESDAGGVPRVAADRDWILRVLANLVENGLKFTSQGGRVSVRARAAGPACIFTVEDTGCGIAPSDLPHVFDRYWRGDISARSGAGLGLAIAKGVVNAHGGRIWVESTPGKGSAFHFTLPFAASREAAGRAAMPIE